MSLIAHYPLISNAKDTTMGNNHGTASGAFFGTGGKLGGFVTFTLTSDKIVIPHSQLVSGKIFGKASKLSISVWVYPTAWVDYGVIVSKMTNNSYSSTTVGIWQDTTGFKFVVGTNQPDNSVGSYAHITYKPALNAWYNLIGILDGTNMKFIVNGTNVGTIPLTNITKDRSSNTANITIGPRIESTGDSGVRGNIADLRVFDHVLSTREIMEINKAKVAHYNFEDFPDPTIISVMDSSGYDRDIVDFSSTLPSWTTDAVVGKGAYDFSVGQCSMHIPYGNAINPSTLPHTISLWVKTPINTGDNVFFSSSYIAGRIFYIGRTNGKWDFGIQGNGWGTGVTPVVANKWTNITLVLNGSTARLFVDGVFSISKSYSSFTFASDFYIGNMGIDYYWDGQIDDVKIYSSAFSDDEINKLLYRNRGSIDENGTITAQYFDSSIGFIHKFYDNPITYEQTTVEFNRNGIVRLTSTDVDPKLIIDATASQELVDGLSSIDPSIYKFFQFKYRIVSGNTPTSQIFFSNARSGFAEDQSELVTIVNDGDWHVASVDMSANAYWTDSPLAGLRLDYAGSGITMDIEYIRICKDEKQIDFTETGGIEAKGFIEEGGLDGIALWWPLDNTLDEVADVTATTASSVGATPNTFINKMGYDLSGSLSRILANGSKAPMTLGSLSFWVNIDSAQSWAGIFYLISAFSSDNSFHWLEFYRLNSTTIRLTYSTASGSGTSLDIPNAPSLFVGKPAHVCILYSDSNNESVLKVYVNANLIGTIAVATAVAGGIIGGDLYLMADSGQYYTKGKISDVRFYKKLLTDIDVILLYEQGKGTSKTLMKELSTGELYVKGTFREG